MAASGSGEVGGRGAKVRAGDQIRQAVQSTSNLFHLLQDSSTSQDILAIMGITACDCDIAYDCLSNLFKVWQVQLTKLPKNLLAKISTIRHTGQILDQLPQVISSLDAYMESSLNSAPQLKPIAELLSNMETSQLKYASPTCRHGRGLKGTNSGEVSEP